MNLLMEANVEVTKERKNKTKLRERDTDDLNRIPIYIEGEI